MSFHPPERLTGQIVTLRRYRLSDGPVLAESVETSREHLEPWMPWARGDSSDPSTAEYLRAAASDFGGDHAADYAMVLNENRRFAGSCGLMPRIGPAALEIGYWVDVRYLRRGIATEAAKLLTAAAFGSPGISRVEIHVDEANDASNAVPRRLGYKHDRTEPSKSTAPGASNRIWIMNRDEWARNVRPAAGVAASGRIAERGSE